MNSKQLGTKLGREAVRKLMFDDGLGEEALDCWYAEQYAIELTGNLSRTAVAHVERHIRSILNDIPAHKDEGSLAHFDRYIAGDR